MSKISAPPIYDPVVDDENKANLSWILFFNQMFSGDNGTSWTPTFSGLTTSGSPTITGRYYKISQSLCFFSVRIVPATNTSAVAGTTYINNFPLSFSQDGIVFAVSGLLGTNSGMIEAATNRVYVPTWTTVTVPLTIIGMAEIK